MGNTIAAAGAAGASAPARPSRPRQETPAGGEPRDTVQLSRPYKAPQPEDFHPAVDESERTPEVVEKQRQSIDQALTTDQPVEFRNSEGKTVEVSVKKTETGYTYTLDGHPVDVTHDASYDEATQKETLAQMVDYHSQQPPYALDAVKKIHVAPTNTQDSTAAQFSGSDESITFFGREQLNEANFTHELGHGVGYKLSGKKNMVPEDWSQAVERDGREVSGYGKQSADEKNDGWLDWVDNKMRPGRDRADDFAEAYSGYIEARESGPEALAEFRRLYPERARILDRMYMNGQYVDSPLGDQPVYA